MRVLYYLEPHQELGDPLFRLATVRKHLERETRGLLDNGVRKVEIAMLCSGAVAHAVRREGLLPEVTLFTIAPHELAPIYPDYVEAGARWYNRDYSPTQLERMAALCARKLDGFVPDAILCWESSAPFLEHLFPRALFLHSTFGIFSRAPYPETSILDPFGLSKESYLRKYQRELRSLTLSSEQRQRLLRIKDAYQSAQLQHTPVLAGHVRPGPKPFEHVVLLPLQVSRYFMFDENCPPELRTGSQLEFMKYVLERVDPSVGVYVTMHSVESNLFTPEVMRGLRRKYPNFLFSDDLQRLKWASQHILPHVDAVVSVSSSLGLQALIWDLPVVALGHSHLTGIASSTSLTDLPRLLAAGKTQALDGALHHLLMHYYPLADRYHHRGAWFIDFLERGIAKKQTGLDFNFFAPIDEPAQVERALIDALRPAQYQSELRKSLRQGGPSLHVPEGDLARGIAEADLVSFDVFDTLVTRPLIDPRAVFDLMAPRARALLAPYQVDLDTFGGFRRLRVDAAGEAARHVREQGSEEYDLNEVYQRLCTKLGVPAMLAQTLKGLEEEIELAIHQPRESGRLAFQQAIDSGKRTILISDMFLDTAVVAEILRRCGYTNYSQLYVSSEHKVLKRTGRLYERIRSLEGDPKRWLHVGDNRGADLYVPGKLGIRTHYLPNISELYAASPHVRDVWRADELEKTLGTALHHGVISRKFYDRPTQGYADSWFEGKAYRLGYEAGGPLLLAFVEWLIVKARRDKLTDLYFLARDGYLPKQIYDLIATKLPGLPRSHYLYASRRAYAVPGLRTPQDILHSIEDLRHGRLRVSELLLHRFGVQAGDVPMEAVKAAGFVALDDTIDVNDKIQRKRLEVLLTRCSEPILARAEQERSVLLDYLRSEGLGDETRRAAVVDIGNNASLQVKLAKLMGRADLKGYYFATFHGARKPYGDGLDISGYLVEFEDASSKDHVYTKNMFMFELLFLPAIATLEHIKRSESGGFAPVFVEGDESKRFQLVAKIHQGVLDFCKDISHASADQPWLFELSKNEALKTFARYASKPARADALMLDGVSFVDGFGGRVTRYLIASPLFGAISSANLNQFVEQSSWKAGARAVAGAAALPPGTKKKTSATPSDSETAPWERKLRKLLRDPKGFALDTKLARSARKLIERDGTKK